MEKEILFDQRFLKNFHKRISTNQKLIQRFNQQLIVLSNNPESPKLKLHRLKGKMKNYFSFSITSNYRVIYKQINKTIILVDIGTHNQVY
jgi:addiction module RelE/StbE family toxin